MGQTSSGDRVTQEWAEVHRQASTLKELAFLTYESFTATIKQLNQISKTFTDSNGRRLVFVIKPGTDSNLLWKATVKIGCIRLDVRTEAIVSYRLLNLKQYMQVYRLVICQVGTSSSPISSCSHSATTTGDGDDVEGNEEQCGTTSDLDVSCEKETKRRNKPLLSTLGNTPLTTSMILEEVSCDDQHTLLDECCICMERKPELILPCAHSYCVPCIEQWNVSSKTCPVCREALESTDDSWVISEAPEASEVEAELRKILSGLAKENS